MQAPPGQYPPRVENRTDKEIVAPMVTTRSKNHVHTPAVILALSLDGYVATAPDPVDARIAAETACPRCRTRGLRCRGFENEAGGYRIVLSCACGWASEA